MFVSRSRVIGILVICFCLTLAAIACERSPESSPPPVKNDASLIDTVANREAMALRLINAYPREEWGDDIMERLSKQVGSGVAGEVQAKIRSRMNQKEIMELRIQLLTDTFSAAELAELAEVYARPDGKSAIRKMALFEERVKEQIEPVVMQALSGK